MKSFLFALFALAFLGNCGCAQEFNLHWNGYDATFQSNPVEPVLPELDVKIQYANNFHCAGCKTVVNGVLITPEPSPNSTIVSVLFGSEIVKFEFIAKQGVCDSVPNGCSATRGCAWADLTITGGNFDVIDQNGAIVSTTDATTGEAFWDWAGWMPTWITYLIPPASDDQAPELGFIPAISMGCGFKEIIRIRNTVTQQWIDVTFECSDCQ